MPWGVADGPVAMRAKVREMVGAGADVIKTATTGGASSTAGLGPKDVLFERAELEALVDEAHKRGRRVMCHALGGPGLRMAIEVGVDSIEHGSYLDEDPELLEMMARERHRLHANLRRLYIPRRSWHAARQSARRRAARAPCEEPADGAGARRYRYRRHGRGRLGARQQRPRTHLPSRSGHDADAGYRRPRRATRRSAWGWMPRLAASRPASAPTSSLSKGNPLDDISILERGKAVKYVMKDGITHLDTR